MDQTPAPTPPTRPRDYAKLAIGVAVFVAGVGNSFVFAVLPPVGREMGLTEVQIGSIITLSAFIFMTTAPIWGARSERWGRRKVILFGQAAYGITTLFFALTIHFRLEGVLPLAVAYGGLLFFRALFTSCISGIFPASQAYLADVTPPHERTRAMAIIGVSIGLGMAAGPASAGLLSRVSLVFPFYVVAMLSVVAVLFTLRTVKEPVRHAATQGPAPLNQGFRAYFPFLLVSTLVMCNLAAVQQATGFYVQDKFGLDAQATAQRVGMALMATALSSVVAQIFIVRRFGWPASKLLKIGAPVAACGVALLLIADHYAVLVAAMACFGLGQGMIMPGNIAALSMAAGAHEQGRAAGVNTSAQGFGFMFGPMIGSAFYVLHPLAPYATCLGLLAVLIVHVYVFVPYNEPAAEAGAPL